MNITSQNAQGTFDTCSVSLSGITANSFTTISVSQAIVQTMSPLTFNLQLPTPLQSTDQIHITFASVFDLTSLVSNSVLIKSIGNFALSKSGNKLVLVVSISQPIIDSILNFDIPNVILPFTTAATSIQVSVLTVNGYFRVDQVYSYTPLSGSIASGAISCSSQQIGVDTSCSYVLTTTSSLASTA